MKNPSSISPTEMTVLKSLWRTGPTTVRDLCDFLAAEGHDWAYTTVQTLLNRLQTKGFVTRDADGIAHTYAAAVSQRGLIASRLTELAEQLCDGAPTQLLSALVDAHRFSPVELAKFRKLLDEQCKNPNEQ